MDIYFKTKCYDLQKTLQDNRLRFTTPSPSTSTQACSFGSSSQSHSHLLELPLNVLHKILHYIAYEDFRYPKHIYKLPYQIIPVATTCKRLRQVAATLLPVDSAWNMPNHTYLTTKLAPLCPHLSDTIQAPVSNPSLYECQYYTCATVHTQLAWYSLACPGLRSFDLSYVLRKIPTREVILLLRKLISAKPVLQHIRLDDIITLKEQKLQDILPVFSQLIRVTGCHLESISLSSSIPLRTTIIDTFLLQPLPKIKTIQFVLDKWISDWNIHLNTVSEILQHCLRSGSKIVALEFTISPIYFHHLEKFVPFCPYVDELYIRPPYMERNIVPCTINFTKFQARNICFDDVCILKAQLLDFARSVANDDRIETISFRNCQIHAIHRSILFMESNGLAKKIKTLEFSERCTSTLIESIACCCPNLFKFSFWCTMDCMNAFGLLLKNAKELKHLNMRVFGFGAKEQLETFTYAINNAKSSLETFGIEGLHLSPTVICQILDKFGNALRNFAVDIVNPTGKEYDLGQIAVVFKHIAYNGHLTQLERLRFPIQELPAPELATVEDEFVIAEIKKLIKMVKQKCEMLDLEDFEIWINS